MKFLFDLFPVLLFFAAFKIYGIFVATAVAIVATFLQISWMWLRHRKVDSMYWTSLVIIVLLGGATLVLQDEAFIKWKPTVLYWLFAVVLWVSVLFFKKNLIKALLQKQMMLTTAIWRKLNISWIVFFVLMGWINIYIAFNYPIETWVNFKLFGSFGLMLVFLVIQAILLSKHIKDPKDMKAVVTLEGDYPLDSAAEQKFISQRKGEDS